MSTHPNSRAGTRLLVAASLATLPAITWAANGVWNTTGPYGGTVTALEVYEAAPSTLYAGGSAGVFRSVNSGASWQRKDVGLPQSMYVQDIAAATTATVVYAARIDRIYRSGNAGDYWVQVSALPADTYVDQIAVRRGTSNSIAVASSNGVYVSDDGGSTWAGPGTTASGIFAEVAWLADGTLYAAVRYPDPAFFAGAQVLRSVDGGAIWTALPAQPGLTYVSHFAVSAADPQWLAVTDGGLLQVSPDGGASWSARALPASGAGCGSLDAIALHPSSTSAAVVACSRNGVHITSNFASTSPTWAAWTPAAGLTVNGTDPVQANAIVLHPAFASTPTAWVATWYGGLLRSTNGGTNWSAINTGYEAVNIRALATHPLDTGPGAVILAGQGDTTSTARAVVKSPDAGGTWQLANTGLNAEQIRSLAIDPTTVDANPLTAEPFTVYAAGRAEALPTIADRDGGIYKSTDGGDTWTTIDNGIAIIGGGPFMGTVRTVALDPRSCASPPSSGPCAAGSGPLQTVFIAGSGVFAAPATPYLSARIYKSTNGGANWTPSDTGLPLGEELGAPGSGNYAFMGGVNPLVFDPSNTQTIYIGTFLGYYADPESGLIPTIANGVFKSTDGGATWVHSSNGLPRYFGTGPHQDVLALAINPANPSVLYAGVSHLIGAAISGSVYKSTDGGANWFAAATGIAGQDVRALFIDPNDASGDTIYAGTGGDGANPGGVFRSTDGGATWNSYSIGLPAYAATALAMPARSPGAPARILAGTNAGVWDYTEVPDEDADGAPSAVENTILGGDGNGDGQPDAQQPAVASFAIPASTTGALRPDGSSTTVTIDLVGPASCTQLNDSNGKPSDLFPPDPLGDGTSAPWGLVAFSVPACTLATVRVVVHGASFDDDWTWRNYGPRTPGDTSTFGWYTFAGARRIDAQTWELAIDARRQGNYRSDDDDILFIGGPAHLPDLLFGNGFE